MPRRPPEPLASAPLAYENPDFLNSPDGRLFRIIAEYQEPMARFRRERVQDTVVFKEYLETVVKERDGWKDLYRACRAQLS